MKKKKDHFLKTFRTLFSAEEYTPLSQTALFKQEKISLPQKKYAKDALKELFEEEFITLDGTDIKPVLKKKKNSFIGTLRMNPRGFGFVIADDQKLFPDDAFIAKHLTGSAIDGDLVEVDIFPKSKKDKGPEGKVLSVLERGRSHLGGIVRFIEEDNFFIFSPLLGPNKPMRCLMHKDPLKPGDRVIVKVVEWGGPNNSILCEVTQVLGHIDDPSIDVSAAAEEFQIANVFSKEVVAQAKAYGKTVSKKDCAGREDFTELETLTIDPTTAKDFDDALSLTKDSKGQYHLGVHIADVAHYVKPNTPLDAEAVRRSNSTYFPGACLPMLPEELSNNLCSLKEKVVRLCISVLMTFSKTGKLINYEIKRSFIKSAKRFTYEDAMLVLDGKKKSKFKPLIELMVELCHLLKKHRSGRGTIDFSLPEVVLNMAKTGEPLSYHIVEYDITHQLVEEFMLKANEVVATSLNKKGFPLIFRIHEEPASESRDDFFMLARSLGFSVPPKPEAKDIQKLFEEAKATPYAQRLSIAFIRSMKLASYSSDNIGHYGLALEDYCHFTSPIRRYPDLIIQRLLFDEHDTSKNLQSIADGCSAKERVSFKAEQSVKTLKKIRLLKSWHEEDPVRIYDCQITKIKPFGVHFELVPLGIEGFLHVSEIEGDYFIHEPDKNAFVGRKTNVRLCIGDVLKMQISSIDLILLEVKWEQVLSENTERRPSSSGRTSRKKEGIKNRFFLNYYKKGFPL